MFFTTAWYYIFCLCNLVLDEILSQGPIFSHSKIKQQTNPENWSILQTHFKVNYLGIISLPGHGLFAVAPSACTEAGLCVALLEEPHLLTVPPRPASCRNVPTGLCLGTDCCLLALLPLCCLHTSVPGLGIRSDVICLILGGLRFICLVPEQEDSPLCSLNQKFLPLKPFSYLIVVKYM